MRYPHEFASGLAWVREHRSLSTPDLAERYALPITTTADLLERGDARSHARRGDIPITCLEDLPAHRLPVLLPAAGYGLGRYPELLDPDLTQEEQIARLSLMPCGIRRHASPPSRTRDHAKEGEDGLYHLRSDGRAGSCDRDSTHHAPVRLWRERLSVRPAVVPENLRCEPSDRRWGTDSVVHTHRTPRMVRIVDELRTVQGLSCGACHKQLSTVVDHDHATGMVRGLLCTPCNVAVDSCPHLAGCPLAEYLNAPPAPAGIRYPRHRSSPSAP
ncbi:endonuclease domain-containing protein [Brachybacterium sp. AOP3-A1-3]|uniref:endonuclease domain-containing protein n=1 Tax=Brachybacterium sp. AOP3-A1-3 TaxID=3457699 RepID=UPI004033EB24